ncbi:aromatic-ring-hydroxylating dioxygenase subunit beta [uncultured Azohydromonas sp.]|uniref:aromatic-ring-hydroxylating dioxygenase subunit beta n=1 Tax=uncultured Azohydromonas sp. TaxID=487342 RepID=UPI0026138BFF|nr:aromatic-ring-hydroxylating dioxygenase subunit beta [uncultured Azohydromonas sp.]
MDHRHAVSELIARSMLMLDAKDFEGYLSLCDEQYRYRISAHSPEIRKDMIWLEHDKLGMRQLFANLPRHNSDQSPLSRHVTVYTVEARDEEQQAKVVSALQVFRTSNDGGVTELFAVGKVHDTVKLGPDGPRLLARDVRLDTRMLGYGHHIPF